MIGDGMHGFGMWGFGHFGWLGMVLGLILNLALIVGVVLLVIWLVRRVSGAGAGGSPSVQSPREILQARYARGEITREQYQEILADLNA
jgi:putative membrane protein